jgi:hypothetical protein
MQKTLVCYKRIINDYQNLIFSIINNVINILIIE